MLPVIVIEFDFVSGKFPGKWMGFVERKIRYVSSRKIIKVSIGCRFTRLRPFAYVLQAC